MSIVKKPLNRLKTIFLLPFFSLFLTIFTLLSPSLLGNFAFADPTNPTAPINPTNPTRPTETTTPENTETPKNSQNPTETKPEPSEKPSTPETCSDAISGVGWIVCPGTGFFAKAIDGIYHIISDFLSVKPITFATDSPLHTVWRYFRDLTNIIFIILLIIVVYSHLTGLGLSNYNIKRILPRIIVAAVMINLSFLICTLAVDISNLLGSGLRGFFNSVAEATAKTSRFSADAGLGWGQIAALLLTGVGTGTLAVIAAGGITTVLLLFIPVVLGALVAVLAGLLTIAARQAVIWLLVMTAPLAFVAYLLPNTEQWFKKWRTIFFQMLIFYPTFSLLFGASHLAGFAIIASADNTYNVILGMAVQVFPLFFSVNLMKMSGTVLDKINPASRNLLGKASAPLSDRAKQRAALSAQRYYNKGATATHYGYKGFKLRNAGAMINSAMKRRDLRRQDEIDAATLEGKTLDTEYINALKTGKKIIAYNGDRPIYKTQYIERENTQYDPKNPASKPTYKTLAPVLTETPEFIREQKNRLLKNRAALSDLETEKAFGSLSDYIERDGVKLSKKHSAEINARLKSNLTVWKDSTAIKSAIASNEAADKRFMHESIRNAAKTDKDGNIIDAKAYDQLIFNAAGYDAYGKLKSTEGLTGEALKAVELENQQTNKFKNDALIKVVSKSTEAFEAERAANVKMYATFAKKNLTKDITALYQRFLDDKNIDGIVAMMQELNLRGDNDVIGEHLGAHMDREGYLEIGTDFANTLASCLMGLKKSDPFLGRLGKHINVETAQKTIAGSRDSTYITMKEFLTGKDSNDKPTKGSAATYLAGTSYADIDRTSLDNMNQFIELYLSGEEHEDSRKAIYASILPQLVSAMPNYASGGEEIKSVLKHITGLKNKDGKWVISGTPTADQTAEHTSMTEKYLGALTASNIINIKSDAIDAILAKFELDAKADGITGDKAIKEAKKRYVDSFNQDVLRILANSPDVSAIKGRNYTLLEDRLKSLKDHS